MNEYIDSILLANWYLTSCKMQKPSCKKRTELARKFLMVKIQKALSDLKSNQDKKALN